MQLLLKRNGFEEFEKDGWRPTGDASDRNVVNIIQVGVGNELGVVKAGRADLANVFVPFQFLGANTLNTKVLYSFTSEGPFFLTAIGTTEETIRRKPQMVQHFVNALTKGYCYGHRNPEATAQGMVRLVPSMAPQVVEAATLDLIKEDVYPRSPVVSKEAFEKNFDGMLVETKHPAAKMSYEELLDMSFAKKAQAQFGCD